MDGLLRAVGDGITSLFSTAFEGIGGALRAIAGQADATLPGGALAAVVFVGLLIGAWILAKR
jgi:hypothetical protein